MKKIFNAKYWIPSTKNTHFARALLARTYLAAMSFNCISSIYILTAGSTFDFMYNEYFMRTWLDRILFELRRRKVLSARAPTRAKRIYIYVDVAKAIVAVEEVARRMESDMEFLLAIKGSRRSAGGANQK
jgi:hypothetical protein